MLHIVFVEPCQKRCRFTKNTWGLTFSQYVFSVTTINGVKDNLSDAMILVNSIVYNYFREIYGWKNVPTEEEIGLKERLKTFLKKA